MSGWSMVDLALCSLELGPQDEQNKGSVFVHKNLILVLI